MTQFTALALKKGIYVCQKKKKKYENYLDKSWKNCRLFILILYKWDNMAAVTRACTKRRWICEYYETLSSMTRLNYLKIYIQTT